MSGRIIDPNTNMQASAEPVVVCIDKIAIPVPPDAKADSKLIAQMGVDPNTGQLTMKDPCTLALWIETANAMERMNARMDALEKRLDEIGGSGTGRDALRAFMSDDKGSN